MFLNAKSQCPDGDTPWRLQGNDNATNDCKLGTTNSIPLRLYTNNQERLTLTTAGKIGINYPNPYYTLELKSVDSITSLHFTNSKTGFNPNKGLLLGLSGESVAQFVYPDNAWFYLKTFNAQRMKEC